MGFFNKLGDVVNAVGNFLAPFLLLFMRIFWGLSFFFAGYGKFQDMSRVISFFESLNIYQPEFSAYLVATVETVCGLLLLFGLFARVASIPLIIVMVTALFTAHYDALQPFITLQVDSVTQVLEKFQVVVNQLPFNYLITALVVWCFGPGVISIDWLRGKIKK